MKTFHPPVSAGQYEVVFVPALESPPTYRLVRQQVSSQQPSQGSLPIQHYVVEVHVKGGDKLYLTRSGPYCFVSEYRKHHDGKFIAYERRDDSVFGVNEEMVLERLGDWAVTSIPTRFLDSTDFHPRWWLLRSIVSFCHRKVLRQVSRF